MQTILDPREALNKAFRKIKPIRSNIELFKYNLIDVLDAINVKETEEFHKNLISSFLKKTYYDPNYFINTNGKNDLVIHNGKDAKTPVGVIIEAKSPANRSEMITRENLNCKALQELVLYYLRERITKKNTELKYLIVTNIHEWFIFNAHTFNRLFAENKGFVKQFEDFEAKRASGHTTDYFYKNIAAPHIAGLHATIEHTYFDIRSYEKPLRNNDKKDDNKLIALYKLLSPEHLLKLSFANDSNTLDKNFYTELLHILGLTETKEAGKKIIDRNKVNQRHSGSIIENTIIQLESMDKLSRLKNPKQYGNTHDERLFSVALELTITWVNRILFLKLLEAQLISYHDNDAAYSFLNSGKIKDYDGLNTLFFQALARKPANRSHDVQQLFAKVPYLNSSLFEPTDLEHDMFPISQLEDDKTLPLLSNTVIKDSSGKKVAGSLTTLHYFFYFLDAYDFASEGAEEIQEDNKTLINASVLGLIFEKINGYKDGSFFTPGLITMYMCRETIEKAVIQKFNEAKGWDCKTLIDLQNKNYTIGEANQIINSIRICDPAVGSGHFLVSALNEFIRIKSKLRILADHEGRLLKDWDIVIENDELVIYDVTDGKFFKYNPRSEESRRVQETLFKEKVVIIENCLFGVDINQNSVKICRLRLWIELLKNAYYKGPDFKELETLPNIDINIQCGNSLISRFALTTDIKEALKKSHWTIEHYKQAFRTYRTAENKEQKKEMELLIADIKNNFVSNIDNPFKKGIASARGAVDLLRTKMNTAIQWGEKITKEAKAELKKAEARLDKLENDKSNILANKIYENAFEWRFEFPEVLDDNGDYLGFDAIIGNPPYIQLQKMGQASIDLEQMNYSTYAKTGDIYSLFYELGCNLLKPDGILTFITSNKWMRAGYGESLRKFFVEKTNPLVLIDFAGTQIFDNATVDTNILMFTKSKNEGKTLTCLVKEKVLNNLSVFVIQNGAETGFITSASWIVLTPLEQRIKAKIEAVGTPLKNWDVNIYRGILTGYNEAFIIDSKTKDALIAQDAKSAEIIRPILRGRDIKRYKCNFADLWLINTHNGVKEMGIKPIDIDNYPAIKQHLDKYYPELKKRLDKGTTPYNLRNCAYTEDFSKQKIIYPEITKFLSFYCDNQGYMTNNKCFILTGKYIYFLTAFLNSSLFKFCFRDNFPELLGGSRELRKIFLEELPIIMVDDHIEENCKILINQITDLNNKKLDTHFAENQLDDIIFNLYSLSNEEQKSIGYIEIQ